MEQIVNDELIIQYIELNKEISKLTLLKNKIRNTILNSSNISDIKYSIITRERPRINYRAIVNQYLNLKNINVDSFTNNITYLEIIKKEETQLDRNINKIDFNSIIDNAKNKLIFSKVELNDNTFIQGLL